MIEQRLSPSVSHMTRRIIRELDRTGTVRRPLCPKWRSRVHNAARKAGFVVQTRREGNLLVGEVVGW